ncbi:MAG: DUF3662 and FHA domain-containing protein [Coriobacteriia bacterium]|nr:DUF3662 and FHA domain-containing protein [Coriobacteriia bacterium]
MGILSDFEDRIGGAIEGLFADTFRSPVQPVELARALARAADDGRSLGVATVYIPTSYTIALSAQDSANLGTFRATLAGELVTYLVDHAREHGYHLHERPHIEFAVHDDLKLGRFRVSASLGDEPAADDPPAIATRRAPTPEPGMATVTMGDLGHDMVLSGDEVLVGRLAECQIHIADANVSRRHAAFIRLEDGWAITDLGSTNGTRVNGATIERVRLRDGDTIEIGLARLTYHDPRS